MISRTNKIFLPRTGQVTTSPTANFAVGDDGWFQAGNPRRTRYVDNGDGTISDRATSLEWPKDVSQLGAVFWTGGAAVAMVWANAVGYCLGSRWNAVNPLGAVGLSYAGHDDWRLPNIRELTSLWESEHAVPPVADVFANIQLGRYWSSSTHPITTNTYANYMEMNARLLLAGNSAKTTAYYVLPVRGGRLNAGW